MPYKKCAERMVSAKGQKQHLVERIATATNEGLPVDDDYRITYTETFIPFHPLFLTYESYQ